MTLGTALVAVVAIVAWTVLRLARHYSQQERIERAPLAENDESRREIADLRERIKVLERIATEGHTLDAVETRRISAEIEALREKQAD